MTAEEIYVDPSALAQLYIRQDGSLKMVNWRRRFPDSLTVTHHGKTEIINAISLALFRRDIPAEEAEKAFAYFEDDFTSGRLIQADILWRAALQRAAELSRTHTPGLGTRSLDVLHVACALELKQRGLLTFDGRQGKLAAAVGLKTILL